VKQRKAGEKQFKVYLSDVTSTPKTINQLVYCQEHTGSAQEAHGVEIVYSRDIEYYDATISGIYYYFIPEFEL